ncbi:TPA: hypothetical protein EYP38_01980 [Candidatus Micrarchaeota archaeon]|nr:hypothetical protein [Candidatus Micrarchaeota archaeon]
MDKGTLLKFFNLYPDLNFIGALVGRDEKAVDQKIATDMHIWRAKRNSQLHDAIGQRLEQLWGFRELFALMRNGRFHEADVISPSHERMFAAISAFVPGNSICHFFVDQLMDGTYVTGFGKDVLLLSFMNWLTPLQTADALLRLNAAVEPDNEISMTVPARFSVTSDFPILLSSFGFELTRAGMVYLIPPQNEGDTTREKLLTRSQLLQMKKIGNPVNPPEAATLFEYIPAGNKCPKTGQNDIISYDIETLESSVPLISLHGIGMVPGSPEIKQVIVDTDACMLELKGGAVVGFNMDPRHKFTVEREGYRIPSGTDTAALGLMSGGNGFTVPDRLKRKYDDFVKLVRSQRDKIAKVKVTRIPRNIRTK